MQVYCLDFTSVHRAVSEMMTDEIESVREALANEKEERIKSELDAQEVSLLLNDCLTVDQRE